MNFIFEKPFPLRMRPNPAGTITLGATSRSDIYYGRDAKMDRALFIIANLSTTSSLKVQSGAFKNLTTIFPQTQIALPLRDDLYVYNPNAGTVDYEVIELFFDEGSQISSGSRGGSTTSGNRSGVIAGGPGGGSLPGVPTK